MIKLSSFLPQYFAFNITFVLLTAISFSNINPGFHLDAPPIRHNHLDVPVRPRDCSIGSASGSRQKISITPPVFFWNKILASITRVLFKINVDLDSKDNNLFKVRVTDYLTRAPNFHEEEWKLINRLVHNGYVYLDADETVRLIRSELTSLIYSRVKTMTLSFLASSIAFQTFLLDTGSIPVVGSSKKTIFGSPISEMANDNLIYKA